MNKTATLAMAMEVASCTVPVCSAEPASCHRKTIFSRIIHAASRTLLALNFVADGLLRDAFEPRDSGRNA